MIIKLLEMSGYLAMEAASAGEARSMLSCFIFDAMIVDWMRPAESGIEFMKAFREETSKYKNIPAIMLTALDDIENKVDGFKAGFDDYITKPFDERELLARIESLIKRTNKKDEYKTQLTFGECSFDITSGKLTKNMENVYLTSTEVALLKTLCQKPNNPFSREKLSKKLGFIVSDRTIDVQITRLRKKIGDNPKAPTIIQTIRHIGYAICI